MTTRTPLACVILAAGKGTRMKSALSKVMHPLAGRPMLGWLLDTVRALQPDRVVVVTAPDAPDVRAFAAPHDTVIQHERRGTGDAVKAALPALEGFAGDVLILLGDMPLLSAGTLRALVAARRRDERTGLSVLGGVYAHDTPPFGRLILNEDGALARIVEYKDATPEERSVTLCNTGAFCVDGARLADWVGAIGSDNAQKEYYITDIVAIAAAEGVRAHAHVTHDLDEAMGVNSRADLAALEARMQRMLRLRAMENGATLLDPGSVYFSWDTVLGQDVTVEPHVFFGPGVSVGDGAHIRAFSHFEDCTVEEDVAAGPFARLRPGAVVGRRSRIGNFVEVKNATLGEGVKANHLAYIGDATVGAGVNFSCGAITVNYDGVNKHKTVIGENAMIGSNVSLVAPIAVGDGAYVAAGSTITKDVPADALAVAREKPTVIEGWAATKRARAKKRG